MCTVTADVDRAGIWNSIAVVQKAGCPPLNGSGKTEKMRLTLTFFSLCFLSVSVALRKIETIHLPSVDKPSHHSEMFQKSASLSVDLPQKPQSGDLSPKPQPLELPQKLHSGELSPKPQPQPLELPQKPPIGDLPPKPGELPPKPQLGDLPPKPQLADLPPKPQIKDLPPKPQLGDVLAKTPSGEGSLKHQLSELNQKSHSMDLSPKVQSKEAVQDANDVTHALPETPVPLPRKINTVGGQLPLRISVNIAVRL